MIGSECERGVNNMNGDGWIDASMISDDADDNAIESSIVIVSDDRCWYARIDID